MAHTNSDDLLMEDDIAAAFLGGDEETPVATAESETVAVDEQQVAESTDEEDWVDADDFPGQLAVDVYETADKLVVKARTAGIF